MNEKLKRLSNPVFPEWIYANTVLVEDILPLLGVYPIVDGSTIKVSLLPSDIDHLIPVDFLGTFNKKYGQFVLWAYQEIFHEDLLEQFMYQPCDAVLFNQMGFAFRQRIEGYNLDHYPTYERKFLEFMGISPIISIS